MNLPFPPKNAGASGRNQPQTTTRPSRHGGAGGRNEDTVLRWSDVALAQLNDLRRADPKKETVDQVGFLNGREIVRGCIDHGELGLALGHLLYRIDESTIDFPIAGPRELHELARQLSMDTSYKRK